MNLLKINYEIACNDYADSFCEKQGLKFEGWAANRVGEVALCSDFYFNLSDIIYDIDNSIEKEKIIDWYEWFSSNPKDKYINYENWLKIN